jgi:hypothetical protein
MLCHIYIEAKHVLKVMCKDGNARRNSNTITWNLINIIYMGWRLEVYTSPPPTHMFYGNVHVFNEKHFEPRRLD